MATRTDAAAAPAERRILGFKAPPLSVVAGPLILLFSTYDPNQWHLTAAYLLLLVGGLLVASHLNEKMENSEWRQDLKRRAEAKTASVDAEKKAAEKKAEKKAGKKKD